MDIDDIQKMLESTNEDGSTLHWRTDIKGVLSELIKYVKEREQAKQPVMQTDQRGHLKFSAVIPPKEGNQ